MAIEAVNETVVTVWTAADEARLQELHERKTRIMSENRMRVVIAVSREGLDKATDDSDLADRLIAAATQVRTALKPFDGAPA